VAIHPIWLVLFALVAIIPALVVAVYFVSRFEALKGDVVKLTLEIGAQLKGFEQRLENISTGAKTAREAYETADKAAVKLINLEESFAALSNKWNARERAERNAERKRANREEEEVEEYGPPVIPGTEQQTLPLMPPLPAQPGNGKTVVKPTRSFGQIP
jgi:hypothetical protein